MRKLGTLLVVIVSSLAMTGIARAAEPAKEPAKAEKAAHADKGHATAPVKAGDTVYVCGCGAECKCASVSAKPGKCKCGKDLVKTTVAKVDGDQLTVKLASGEQAFTAPYKCGCEGCNCTPAALAPGKCKCGKELVKNEKAEAKAESPAAK